MDEFQAFEPKTFVSRLLGKGDVGGLMDMIQDAIPEDRQPEMLQNIAKGDFSFRMLKEQFQSILKMGPMSQVGALQPALVP